MIVCPNCRSDKVSVQVDIACDMHLRLDFACPVDYKKGK